MSAMAKIALFSLSCKPFHVFNMFFPFFLHSVFHLHLNSSIIDLRRKATGRRRNVGNGYFRSTIQKKRVSFWYCPRLIVPLQAEISYKYIINNLIIITKKIL